MRQAVLSPLILHIHRPHSCVTPCLFLLCPLSSSCHLPRLHFPRVPALLPACSPALTGCQVRKFKPSLVALQNASLLPDLVEALADLPKGDRPEIVGGEDGIVEVTATAWRIRLFVFRLIFLLVASSSCLRVVCATAPHPSPLTLFHVICLCHAAALRACPALLPVCPPGGPSSRSSVRGDRHRGLRRTEGEAQQHSGHSRAPLAGGVQPIVRNKMFGDA